VHLLHSHIHRANLLKAASEDIRMKEQEMRHVLQGSASTLSGRKEY
jgi:hypothetical protein